VAQRKPPDSSELPSDLAPIKYTDEQLAEQTTIAIKKYQLIRQYAMNVLDITSVVFGAVGASILPVMYAILGARAAVLRVFSQQLERRTFTYSYASPARFIIAGIGGGVIGLFNISIGEGVTASPLALAFLVGYSTDLFFSFLEGSLPNAGKSASSALIPAANTK
jgi:hypothetical protein